MVSLHRSGNRRHSSNAELFASAGGVEAAGAVLFDSPALEPRPSEAQSPADVTPPVNRAEWTARVTAARQASRRKSAQSASGLEGTGPDVALEGADPGIAKAARDIELPPWSKGRYGTAIGRAVHGVLQVVDLATGAGLDAAVSSQCLAEGIVEYADVVTALVRSALASDVVQRAAAREHWRESYVGTLQPDGTVLEGFVDLIYREDDGTPGHRRLQDRRHPRLSPRRPSRLLRPSTPVLRRHDPQHRSARPALPSPHNRSRPHPLTRGVAHPHAPKKLGCWGQGVNCTI